MAISWIYDRLNKFIFGGFCRVEKKGNVFALVPLGVFLVLYLATSIILNDFYKMPVIVAFLIATMVALFMNRKRSLEKTIEIFCQGVANNNIIIMLFIFILAGAFAGLAKDMGAVDATVNFGLSVLPSHLLLAGVFVIGCFISLSIGTSVGTIVALIPVTVGIAEQVNLPIALAVGCVVSGAMFGDNLSLISDTTIAATKTQGCDMRDKFITNIKIVLPGALLSLLIYLFTQSGSSISVESGSYQIVKILPYLFVIASALFGLNVILVLIGGTLFSGIVAMGTGTLSFFDVMASINKGILNMSEIIILTILIAGMVEIIKENGGIDFILYFVKRKVKSKKGAQIGIAALVGLINLCTANNTVAIVIAGPLAKDISEEYGIEPKKTASILDTFSCFFQGIIPYGAQILIASSLAHISPIEAMRYLYYPYLMGISAFVFILLGLPRDRKIKNEIQ